MGDAYEALGNREQAIIYFKVSANLGDEDAKDWLEEKGIE
jgi:hypothetical protein